MAIIIYVEDKIKELENINEGSKNKKKGQAKTKLLL